MRKNHFLKFPILNLIFPTVALLTMHSCQKDAQYVTIPKQTAPPVATSTLKNTDSFLKAAIEGSIIDYQNIGALEQLLLDHAPLSDEVLKYAIATQRIPDQTIEFITILSAPVHQNVIDLLQTTRTNLSLASILEAQSLPEGQEFIVAFTSRRTIIFGTSLTKLPKSQNCDVCSSQILGSEDSRMIQLTEADNEPSSISKNCNSNVNTCGHAVIVKKEGRESHAIYTVHCDTSIDMVCINGVL